MVAYIIIGSISFIVLVGLMAYLIPLWYHPKHIDTRTSSQKILDRFEIKEDTCDLNKFIQFCKENPAEHNIKNSFDKDGFDEDIEDEETFTMLELDCENYETIDDDAIKVKKSFLRGYNKNDCVLFAFSENGENWVEEYKIISTVVYGDGDYYHCQKTH
jgi:hypothetical protein